MKRVVTIAMRKTQEEDWTDAQKKADFVCDGIDDQVEIQAAIDAVGRSGGHVLNLSPDAIYNLEAPLEVTG